MEDLMPFPSSYRYRFHAESLLSPKGMVDCVEEAASDGNGKKEVWKPVRSGSEIGLSEIEKRLC